MKVTNYPRGERPTTHTCSCQEQPKKIESKPVQIQKAKRHTAPTLRPMLGGMLYATPRTIEQLKHLGFILLVLLVIRVVPKLVK